MTRAPHYWQGLRVPWISPWSTETARDSTIVRRRLGGQGIGYADEHHIDRRHDVLWVRLPATPGRGTPRFAGVHALRQRQAMDRMRCQVCGAPAERPDGRYLFLIRSTSDRPIAEGERTAAPPVHDACAREAVRDCPHLRRGWTAALVTGVPSWGVAGVLYDHAALRPLPSPGGDGEGLEYVSYDDDDRLRWVLAAREVITLYGVEPVDVDSLADSSARTGSQMVS